MSDKNCQYSKDDVWNYFSSLLPEDQEDQIQEHILSCEDCQQELNKLRKLASAFENIDYSSIQEDDEIKPKARKIKLRPIIIGVSVAAILIVLLMLLLQSRKSETYPVNYFEEDNYGIIDTCRTDSSTLKIDTITSIGEN